MPAQVLVWLPVAGSNSVGHAALYVKADRGRYAYISWYPQALRNQQESTFGNNYTKKGAMTLNRFSDDLTRNVSENPAIIAAFSIGQREKDGKMVPYQANPERGQFYIPGTVVNGRKFGKIAKMPKIIILPGEGEDGNQFGLNLDNIILWWEAVTYGHRNGSLGQFKLYSKHKNCASMVIAALRIGGASLFGKRVKNLIANTPANAETYAENIRVGILKANNASKNKSMSGIDKWFGDFKTKNLTSNDKKKLFSNFPEDGSRLMSYDQWYELSYVRALFANRNEQVKHIDKCLKKFHEPRRRENGETEETLVGEMLLEASDHLRTKPGSNRRMAMLYFFSHLMKYVNSRNMPRVIKDNIIRQQAHNFSSGNTPAERIQRWVVDHQEVRDAQDKIKYKE